MTAGRALLADLQAPRPSAGWSSARQVDGGAPGRGRRVVKDGDRLVVPRITQEVTVIGEVQSPTSHLYQASLSRTTISPAAAARRSVRTRGGSTWFARMAQVEPGIEQLVQQRLGVEIRPGDTVVVPLDAQRMRPLTCGPA
jgi:polysaccharide biosynthesis/export protein